MAVEQLRRSGTFLLDHVPFLGRLSFRSGAPWKKAFAETAVSIVLSSISIWVGAIALSFAGQEGGFAEAANRVVSNGELYLLSSAAVSPLFYITLIKYRPDDEARWITVFPHGILYILYAIITISISVAYITTRAIFEYAATTIHNPLNPLLGFSWILYGLSLFVYLTASLHKYIMEDTKAGVLREDEKIFGEKFRDARDA